MDLGLKGKVAMVAGASRGLGFAVAKTLASEGAIVSMASRDRDAIAKASARVQEEVGGTTIGCVADVCSAENIATWHRKTVERFGGIDLLVTNSGGPPPGRVNSFDDAGWQNAFELILLSTVRTVRVVAPSMIERRGGSILMLTSSSVREPITDLALSNVLRASVAALAKTLSIELAGHGIRVNQLIPGRIATGRVRELDDVRSKAAGISVKEQEKRVAATIPLGRYGNPEELASAAAFLLSAAASYITGATLQVDGGLVRSVI